MLPTQSELLRRNFMTPLDANMRKAIGAAAVQLGPMVKGGLYYLTADVDCFFRQGATGMTAPTTSTGDPLWAKERAEIHCGDGTDDAYVDVITSGGAGTAYLVRAT
jgi:hypothetical protein